MDYPPKPGDRVKFYVECEYEPMIRTVNGTVIKLYPDLNESTLQENPFTPENWHAAVKVDEKPSWWSYVDTDLFAPQIINLSPL